VLVAPQVLQDAPVPRDSQGSLGIKGLQVLLALLVRRRLEALDLPVNQARPVLQVQRVRQGTKEYLVLLAPPAPPDQVVQRDLSEQLDQ